MKFIRAKMTSDIKMLAIFSSSIEILTKNINVSTKNEYSNLYTLSHDILSHSIDSMRS